MENKMNQKTMDNNGTGVNTILDKYIPEFMNLSAAHICKAEAEGVYMFNGCYISILYMKNGDIQDYLYRQLCRYDVRTGKMLTPMFNEAGAVINYVDLETGNMLVNDMSELVTLYLHTPFYQRGFNVHKLDMSIGNPQINMMQMQAGSYANMPGIQGQVVNAGFIAPNQGYPYIQHQPVLQGCLNPMAYNNSPVQTQGYVGGQIVNPADLNAVMASTPYEYMSRQVIGLTQAVNEMTNAVSTILNRIDDIEYEQAKVKSCGKFDLPLENGPKLDKLEAEVLKNKRLKEEGSNGKIKEYMDFPELIKGGKDNK